GPSSASSPSTSRRGAPSATGATGRVELDFSRGGVPSDNGGMSPPDRSADSPAPFGSVLGVCSILHEAPGAGSAHLDFNGTPVLRQTLERLARCSNLGAVALLCWDDQLPAASAAADETGAHVLPHGPRGHIPAMHAASVAQRW